MMTIIAKHPCSKGLTRECFELEPDFARRAFALRLLFAFVPPEHSKRFMAFLRSIKFKVPAILPPGIALPPGVSLIPRGFIPPSWKILKPDFQYVLVPPGETIAPGWKFGGPYPDLSLPPPNFWRDGFFLPNPPYYLDPNFSGPPGSPYRKQTPEYPFWFEDNFDSLDTSYWNVTEQGGGTVTQSSGQVTLKGLAFPDIAAIRSKKSNSTIGETFTFTLRSKMSLFGGGFETFGILFRTNTNHVRITWEPPDSVSHGYNPLQAITVPSYDDSWEIWKFVYDHGYTDLWRNDELLMSGVKHQEISVSPGAIDLNNNYEIQTIIDYLTIEPF